MPVNFEAICDAVRVMEKHSLILEFRSPFAKPRYSYIPYSRTGKGKGGATGKGPTVTVDAADGNTAELSVSAPSPRPVLDGAVDIL